MTPTSLLAECEDCRWYVDSGRYDADRMAARRHAEKHKHRVRVETTKAFTYDGRAAAQAG